MTQVALFVALNSLSPYLIPFAFICWKKY